MVEATSVRQENGEIILEADNGTVSNSGTLDASGKATGETGGTVKVLGQQVAVADGAKIDVSGDAGGGTALIGGNLHGAGPEPNAQNTTVGKATHQRQRHHQRQWRHGRGLFHRHNPRRRHHHRPGRHHIRQWRHGGDLGPYAACG